ncbi:MAG TPA: substrate-binding domain-containing protein [Bradyrhizobium sp.]|uniref:molybdate ABC transporter substrate-binding protein n=1 Tax=Bradyrhizobium sp. TaxID=376 RepID=UPI002D7F7847|nr:substrate-binding domain-containing protein [Bradyrhizobium sp.]HET7885092.1 substrate-binding domain-containing protein [Bradyrhizobium sp.]
MKIRYRIAAIVAVATPLLTAEAQAAEIKVLASTAVKTTLEELAPQFEKATGSKVDVTFSPASVLKEKIDQGTAFDVAILTTPIIDGLASSGKIETTRTAIAHSGIGIAIKKGAAKPDIATSEAFKQALLKANSVGYTAGGATGAYLKTLFEKLGIADALKPKLKLLQGGVGEAVTNGEIEIGMTQISEILPHPGAELAGPLPADIQSYTSFSAGVSAASKEVDAAKAFVKFLAGPPALAVIKAKGMEPG